MRKRRSKNSPKATAGDIVSHNGKRWSVLDRDYDEISEQSYYLIQARAKHMDGLRKWVRSDYITVR